MRLLTWVRSADGLRLIELWYRVAGSFHMAAVICPTSPELNRWSQSSGFAYGWDGMGVFVLLVVEDGKRHRELHWAAAVAVSWTWLVGLAVGSSISHLWHLNFRPLRLNQPSKLRWAGAAASQWLPQLLPLAVPPVTTPSSRNGVPPPLTTQSLTCRWTRHADPRMPPVAVGYWVRGAPSSGAPRVTSSCRSKSCSAPWSAGKHTDRVREFRPKY